jgi:hypothetical protein
MAKRELTPLRTFTFPVVTHETIGPVRAETCYTCKHARHKGAGYWQADFCAYFKCDLKPAYHRAQASLDAEREAEKDGRSDAGRDSR